MALNKGTIDSLRAKLAASDAAVRATRAETLRELRRKIAEEANFVYEALLIIDKAAREGQ